MTRSVAELRNMIKHENADRIDILEQLAVRARQSLSWLEDDFPGQARPQWYAEEKELLILLDEIDARPPQDQNT